MSAGTLFETHGLGQREFFLPDVDGHIITNPQLLSAISEVVHNPPRLIPKDMDRLVAARSEPTQIVIHQHFTFNGRHTAAERAEAVATARAAGEEAVAALEREVQRGGNKAKLFGRRS